MIKCVQRSVANIAGKIAPGSASLLGCPYSPLSRFPIAAARILRAPMRRSRFLPSRPCPSWPSSPLVTVFPIGCTFGGRGARACLFIAILHADSTHEYRPRADRLLRDALYTLTISRSSSKPIGNPTSLRRWANKKRIIQRAARH